ncbi:MAG: hypothetical protein JO083_05630 [Candidatus Eremiobacteraeota bacterium]|nr:hypothetical protein [Candidatus Eremiobacteraeota bacterium]
MLTLQIPTLLAVLATALMAVVIFAPERAAPRPTISFAPPLAPAPLDTAPRTFSRFADWGPDAGSPDAGPIPAAHSIPDADSFFAAAVPQPPGWPALVDRRAAGCDAPARLALVEALLAIETPWARAILQRVLDDERDPAVRAAVTAAGICELDAAGDGTRTG